MTIVPEAEAAALTEAARTRRPLAPLSERLPDLSEEAAYAIQQAGASARAAAGARVVGRKVGLTSAAMQEMLGVDRPDYGVLFDDMLIEPGAGIEAGRLLAPRIEAEIAFDLARPLEGPDVDVEQVLAATATVRPALEVIDSRIADWRISFEDTIADNASSALVVLGAPIPIDGFDAAAETVTVAIGDRAVSGDGAAVLGHPAEAVAWLARTLADHGEALREGDVVLPGAMAAALPFAPGDVVVARWATLGELEVTVR